MVMNLSKPTFPLGWKLLDGSKILKFVEKQNFIEVFELDNGSFLYLFHDSQVMDKIKKRQFECEGFVVNNKHLFGIKYASHQTGDILKRLKSILDRRGLDAIAGMESLKQCLLRDVIEPFSNRLAYEKYGITPSNGILFFGPPGCGKTFIARRLAEAIDAEILEISEGNIGSPYIHATSNNIVELFKKAQQKTPSVIFIDEISGLVPRRDLLASHERYKEGEINEFLMQMEGCVSKGILVIGATNFPERIDPAILRSGRMDKIIYIAPPDLEARLELFKLSLENRPCSNDIQFDHLADISDRFVSSDIKLIVNNAALKALQNHKLIDMSLLVEEIAHTKPSLSNDELERYKQFSGLQRI